MIRFAALAFSPVLFAIVCAEMAPEPAEARPAAVEKLDQEFLIDLEVRERHAAKRVSQMDYALLDRLQADHPLRADVPVLAAEPIAPRATLVVRRAIPVAPTVALASAAARPERAPVAASLPPVAAPERRTFRINSRRASIVIYRGEVVCAPGLASN